MSTQRPDWRKAQRFSASSKRRAGGWRAKKAGESAEELVMKMGTLYLSQNLAEIRKRPEPYRRIGRAQSNGHFTAAPLSKSGPDFDLALPDGRSGLIEVKSRKGRRVPLRAVGEIQGIALKRRILWGGFGVVMLMLWKENVSPRWWVIDWRRWEEARARGYKSLSDDDLDQLAIPCKLLAGQRPHWLPAVLKAHTQAEDILWPIGDSPPKSKGRKISEIVEETTDNPIHQGDPLLLCQKDDKDKETLSEMDNSEPEGQLSLL